MSRKRYTQPHVVERLVRLAGQQDAIDRREYLGNMEAYNADVNTVAVYRLKALRLAKYHYTAKQVAWLQDYLMSAKGRLIYDRYTRQVAKAGSVEPTAWSKVEYVPGQHYDLERGAAVCELLRDAQFIDRK